MKKLVVVTLSCLSMILAGCAGTDLAGQAENRHISYDAKTPWYDTIEALEDAADLIVIGMKTGEEGTISGNTGMVIGTLSDFVIEKVCKDTSGKYGTGDHIRVFENAWYDEDEAAWCHVADYTMMNTEDRYVLMLSVNRNGDLIYCTPLAVNPGVTSLGNEYRMMTYKQSVPAMTGEDDPVNVIRRDIRTKYQDSANNG